MPVNVNLFIYIYIYIYECIHIIIIIIMIIINHNANICINLRIVCVSRLFETYFAFSFNRIDRYMCKKQLLKFNLAVKIDLAEVVY